MRLLGFKNVLLSDDSLALISNTNNEKSVFGLFEIDVDGNKELKKDTESILSIKKYLEYYEKNVQITNNIINSLIHEESVAIWGAGSYVSSLISTTRLKECKIDYYIDSNLNKIGKYFLDKEIISPTKVKDIFKGTIVICSMLYSKDIINKIKELKISNKFVVL